MEGKYNALRETHTESLSLVRGLTLFTLWVCAFMHYMLEIHCLGKRMCGWCFNINVTAPTTAFCHAWWVDTSLLFGCSNTPNKLFLSLLTGFTRQNILIFLSCWHRSECLHTQVFVHTTCQLSFLVQHAPLRITHQRHFSIQQGHSAYTWMHAGIYCVGSKYLHFLPGLCPLSPFPTCSVTSECYGRYINLCHVGTGVKVI